MARSKGVTISVKVPIAWKRLTRRKQQRLRQIIGRDTRVIRTILGIIEQHERKLLLGKHQLRIDDGKLDKLIMTAYKVRKGYPRRTNVPHDLKQRFPRASVNEISECRSTAIALYESYLRLRMDKKYNPSKPCVNNSSRRIPRWVFSQRFRIVETPTKKIHWWLDLRDSLDSGPAQRTIHERLLLPLKISPFHLHQLERGEVKALQIYTDSSGKWWVTFAVRLSDSESPHGSLPPAVIGIDLGIEKAACASVILPETVSETRFFIQDGKKKEIKNLDKRVSDLQRDFQSRLNSRHPYNDVVGLLQKYRHKRERVSIEHDRVLVRQILDFIEDMSTKYTVYVAIGRLKHIRLAAKKGNFKGRRFRGMIHKWAFARITKTLQHQLAQAGFKVDGPNSRFHVVSEAWTSILCWKCGKKGNRPRQNLFVCPTCGSKCNADMNGAINIAGRLITLTKSLHSVRGLGKWESSVQAGKRSRPKAQGKVSSRGKSLLSEKGPSSGSGESAAVHFVQSDLASFSDGISESDNDPAVVRTMENLSVVETDASTMKQEKETRTSGGIVFQ